MSALITVTVPHRSLLIALRLVQALARALLNLPVVFVLAALAVHRWYHPLGPVLDVPPLTAAQSAACVAAVSPLLVQVILYSALLGYLLASLEFGPLAYMSGRLVGRLVWLCLSRRRRLSALRAIRRSTKCTPAQFRYQAARLLRHRR